MYGFLSYMVTQNPNRKFIDRLTDEEQLSRLKRLEETVGGDPDAEELRKNLAKLSSALRSLQGGRDEQLMTRLREDYVRLFRGIRRGYGPPPPYESVYRSEIMMSEHASDVLNIYHRAGLEVRGGEPPDHIGFELAFMAFLCNKEEECREAGDLVSADGVRSLQHDFMSDHILRWMPQFCRNILSYDSGFYTAVAELTLSWLRLEEANARDRGHGWASGASESEQKRG